MPLNPNPYGIQPYGNYYLKCDKEIKTSGLGWFSKFEDQNIVELFLIKLEARELAKLSQTSKSMYIFCYYDDLWKELTLNDFPACWNFNKNWRRTYFDCCMISKNYSSYKYIDKPLKIENFYSDFFFDEWKCSRVDLSQFESMCLNNMDRRSVMTLEVFMNEYGHPNKPVVITDIVNKWRASTEWTKEKLLKRFPNCDQVFQVGRVEIPLKKYFDYCNETQEEIPLYLFDNKYATRYPDLLEDYQVPEYFQNDYFSILDPNDRPNFRWIFIGPPRSSSTFHKDPNLTSAWNAIVTGKKLWIMYPPDSVPPAVFPSSDHNNVVTPISAIEWMVYYYEESLKKGSRSIQCLQYPGDLVYVPSGWWHQVINLDFSIGVTQNIVSDANLNDVAIFLQKKQKKQLWNNFEKAIKANYPDKILPKIKEKMDWKPKTFNFLS